MSYEHFTRQEIPYEILQKFGLTQEMIDDLPQNVTERFLSGRTTPVLPILTTNAEGERVQAYTRISMVRLMDGTVDVCFVPQWEDEDLKGFTPEQQEQLLMGNVIRVIMPGKGLCFIQFDETINQVMAVPADVINQNLSILTRTFNLSDEDKEKLGNGNIVEMELNNQIMCARIDLDEMTGIRVVNGNMMSWQEDVKADHLPKYNFGLYGCWIADEENTLTYVSEDDYTEEMEKEFKRMGTMRAAEEKMKQLKL